MSLQLPFLITVFIITSEQVAWAEEEERPHSVEHAPPEKTRAAPAVRLYTMGQGDTLFERFGHAALCIHYAEHSEQDKCFDYGMTDFSSPILLALDFLRGKAKFWVSVSHPDEMLETYRSLDRAVWLQELPLTDVQAQAVADKLLSDASPTTPHYRYHHSHDNCSTRIRDIIDNATSGSLSDGSDSNLGLSFRDLGRQGFAEDTAVLLVSDLIFGRGVDEEVTKWQAMFLPDYLRVEVSQRLDVAPALVIQRQGRPYSRDPGDGGRYWLALLAALTLIPIALARATNRMQRLGIALGLAIPLGIGLILWGLAALSELPTLRWNEMLLVFLPTDLALVWLRRRWQVVYAGARTVQLIIIAILAIVGVFVQPLLVPLLLALFPLSMITFHLV